MDATRTLGRVIRSRRLELGLTQEELAERIGNGVRQAEVSRLECDRVSLPRRQRLTRIAAALEIPLGELLASAGWAGADAVFRATDETGAESAPAHVASSGATVPPAPNRRVDYVPLHEAIARSQETRAQTARLIEHSRSLAAAWHAGTVRPHPKQRAG
jgi:transcriptional regulator with XRE-family HTH domain